ncbi:hypothetical protein BH24CHL5_BH24CHL5_00160 [soil metagenome]
MSTLWRVAFRIQYRILAALDPLIRRAWSTFGIGNVVELQVTRRSGGIRSRMVGILHADGKAYLGHPNGHVGWTRDLLAAGEAMLIWPTGGQWHFRAVPLDPGKEREQAIRATTQHPFALVYRLGRGHVRRTGVYFRLEDRTPEDRTPEDRTPDDRTPEDGS